jgi:hypothetical protein
VSLCTIPDNKSEVSGIQFTPVQRNRENVTEEHKDERIKHAVSIYGERPMFAGVKKKYTDRISETPKLSFSK